MTSEDIHVYPINDKSEHILVGTECLCNPEVIVVGANLVIIHNAFDFREIAEELENES